MNAANNAANNASNRVKDLIVITGRLADLLTRENRALREHRTPDVTALLEEKNTLSRVYESRVSRLSKISEKPQIMTQVNADLRERLRNLGEKVNGLMEDNAKLLKSAIDANRRVVEAIAEAVKSGQPGPGTYSANGSVDAGGNTAASQTTPISVNRSL